MSNLSELMDLANKDNADSSELLGAAFGTIADLAGVAGAVVMGVGLFAAIAGVAGLFGSGENSLQIVLGAMNAMFDKVNDHIKAGDALARLRQIDDGRAKAKSVFDVLKDAIATKGSADDLDRVQLIQICREAVNDLSTNSAWLTVFLDEIYYDDRGEHMYSFPVQPFDGGYFLEDVGYGEHKPEPDANGDVFTYLYVLPSWIYVEDIFLAVAAALDDQFTAHYQSVLAGDAAFLQQMHDTMASMIQPLSPAAWDVPDLPDIGPPGFSPILEGPFSGNVIGKRIDYGAVELYSGVSRMATYELLYKDLYFHTPFRQELVSNPAVYKKYQIRLLKKQKEVYAAIGLQSVTRLILRLRSIIDPWGAAPTYGDWSFKELCGILGSQSLLDLKKLLKLTPPFDTAADAQGFRALLG